MLVIQLWIGLRAAVIVSFAMLAYLSADYTFNYISVFTVYAVIEASQAPFWAWQWALGDLYSSISSQHRLQEFLLKPERGDFATDSHNSTESKLDLEKEDRESMQNIQLINATIGYKEKKTTILSDVTCTIPANKVTVLLGKVGSGKSTMCSTLLGEADVLGGAVRRPNLRYAFCSQDPWISDGSVKENILLEAPLDASFYDRCLKATALDYDLESLASGDEHAAGKLSGGQKARVALARALYTRSDICEGIQHLVLVILSHCELDIFDDVFAALDKGD